MEKAQLPLKSVGDMHEEWEVKLAPMYISILLHVEFNISKWQKSHLVFK